MNKNLMFIPNGTLNEGVGAVAMMSICDNRYEEKGRKIIVAPSGVFDREAFEDGLARIRAAGLEPVYEPEIFARHRYLAGTDERRLAELQAAIEDPSARAIWMARGGYGATRLLPGLEPDDVAKAEKWFVGFSDATALHALWALRRGLPDARDRRPRAAPAG